MGTRTLPLLAFLLVLSFLPLSGATPHSAYNGFAVPLPAYSLGSRSFIFQTVADEGLLSLSASDSAVYRYGYCSLDGSQWQRFELSGNALGGEWLNGSVSAEITLGAPDFGLSEDRQSTQRNFVVLYSCSRASGSWDCHGGWQILQFNASMVGAPVNSMLLANGFENGGELVLPFTGATQGASVAADGSRSHTGDYSLRIDSGSTENGYATPCNGEGSAVFNITRGPVTVNLTAWTYTPDGSSGYMSIFCLGGDYRWWDHGFEDEYTSRGYTTTAGTWEQQWVSHTCDETVSYVSVRLAGQAGRANWYDDAVLTVISGEGVFSDGVVVGGCENDYDCDDGDLLTDDSCVDGRCLYTSLCGEDGECHSGCGYPKDPDCDQCDDAGDCPAGDGCHIPECTGTPTRCGFISVTGCEDGDGCCPAACMHETDDDCPEGGSAPSLSVSGNGRYLVDESGAPFLLTGDTAWSLIVQPSSEDADYYLQTRRDQGFNTVMLLLISANQADGAPSNHYGDAPFTGETFTTPNEAYFSHADYVLDSARDKGFTVILAPLWIGWMCTQEGWCSDIKAASESGMLYWGRYVGERYSGYDNIIWLVGGDMDPTNADVLGDTDAFKGKLESFVAGIREYNPNALFTVHNSRGQLAVDTWPGASWLSLDNVYTSDADLGENARRAYEISPAKPFFLVEAYYENSRYGITDQLLRAQPYMTVLSGGFGNVFGNCPMWNFGSSMTASFCDPVDWKDELGSVGASWQIYARRLFGSRRWHLLVPDFGHVVFKSGYGTLGEPDYAVGAVASDGSSAIIYMPTQRTVTVDTSALGGSSVRSWWYNPRDGSYADMGTEAESSSRTYTAPTSSGPDWVLVIDGSSASFGPPGM